MAILLTGAPGAGKTTAIRRVAEQLVRSGARLRGFTTDEIRADAGAGCRLGFRIAMLGDDRGGRSAVLAHVDIRSSRRVGRYGVDVGALDGVVGPALALAPEVDVYVVDEIGKMECLSDRFVAAMTALLDSGRPLVATVARLGGGLIERAKARPDVMVLEVTRANRDALPDEVVARLGALRPPSVPPGP